MKQNTRVILALDITDRHRAMETVEKARDSIDAVKVNYPFALACGMDAVAELAGSVDVICDFKVADIPNTNRLIVEQVRKSGAAGVICQAFPGKDSLEACIRAAEGMDVFVVTEMSHPGADRFMIPVAEDMAKLAVEVGATGIIAPATRPEKIATLRKIVGNLKILSPGVGAQGGSASATVKAGADYVIVGRAIYDARDPGEAARKIAEEIRGALQ
ncbi:MAG: orotidine-5'-phosphate decarboxylase [Candidatus Thermoplasmatota archaeon]|nr:orotidine-5'-phosphate decarboxylase [Euryarchaeota archaeon]MBU4032308.1 orotidine-5'-phosphate decarboxylase [Candidatus Thermoplasmatota archaeon]MBU4071109.1 orotidine-5'-phosphate decarboxylase [Candidatus Thermoplasmatota archaeon]MBU4143647.1 orotidine-5'-phosphate decarboxylase [Candidatus Thermoplasmatota archaeon]MBU4591307.1 orotidine-5'-phosphate decarboxylase [Candidatus Thermoplasmatota archaeon]